MSWFSSFFIKQENLLSAICGMYSKNKNNHVDANAIYTELGKHKFDKSRKWQDDYVFLGCHLLFTVPESLTEILPYYDELSSLVITVDGIIDNRDELFALLNVSRKLADMSDSLLILEAYKAWGISCPEKLVGDFVFAIWNIKKQELFCARDHVGKRTFYYTNHSACFAFSTLIEPLFELKDFKKSPNEDFFSDFLDLPTSPTPLDTSMTCYSNIFQLQPASAMLVNSVGIKVWEYWNISNINPVLYNADSEYEAAFLKVFTEAIKCRLRSTKKKGIMLSGGLDSTAIASIAAKDLDFENQLLYGFTQIPMSNYIDTLLKTKLANEKPYVEELCKENCNIIPFYLASEDKSALTEIDFYIGVLEQPYKSFQNNHWIKEIFKVASDNEIGVLLTGQSGNATISYGDFSAYWVDLLKSLSLTDYLNEVKSYAKLHKKSLLRMLISSFYNVVPIVIKKRVYKIRGGIDYNQKLSLINVDFRKKIKSKRKLKDPFFIGGYNSFSERLKLLNPSELSHLGTIETKLSIEYGLVYRDPTRDKRVIEFCMNLPNDQWVRNGMERRLIRVAMKGILPDKIRLNTTVRGRQAADWMQRLIPDWHKAWQEIDTIGKYELERKYLNIPKIKDRLAKNREIDTAVNDSFDIVFLIRALIFARFLRKNFPENQ